jgi:hypothetical protein
MEDILDFHVALSILEAILEKHCLDTHIEMVPLGMGSFLSQFMTEHEGSARVFVHSPCKSYESPQKHLVRQISPCKDFLEDLVVSPKTYGSRSKTPKKEDSPESTEHEEKVEKIQSKLALFLDVSEGKKNQHQGKEAMPSSDVVMASSAPSLSTSLDVNAFLALLHGNELQTWVRSARYRWNKICKMRGLFSFLAEDKKRSAFTAVLSTGHTLKMIVLSWRKLAPKSAKKNSGMSERRKRKDMTQNVQDASIDESKRVADSSRSSLPGGTVNSEHDECAEGRLVSEALVNSGASATEILQESRPAELSLASPAQSGL